MIKGNMLSNDITKIPPQELMTFVNRLYRITGFVTVLCTKSDERPLSFARFYHVRRVVWTANFIAEKINYSCEEVDKNKINWLAWAHDLNRWPFAHNAEKGLFDQAADAPRYFKENNIPVEPEILSDIQNIISKSYPHLTTEGKIVLLADMITGFIEDPLWAVTALDLHPKIVPTNISNYLCINIDLPEIYQKLLSLNIMFDENKTVEPFKSEFDFLFQKIITKFVSKRKFAESIPLGEPSFENWRQEIKEGFMRKKLFAYNNDKISHGARIRQEIIDPLYKKLGSNATSILTTIDETQALKMAENEGILKEYDETRYYPTLDFVTTQEPENSFRRNVNI